MSRGYQPDFDIDREYGDDGEGTVRWLLGLWDKRIEVKRKSYEDGWFYIELEHDPGATGRYKPSGARRTKADYYAYLIGDTGVIVFVPVIRLRALKEEQGALR